MSIMNFHTIGSKVWTVDATAGWVKGEVIKVEQDQLQVRTERGDVAICKPDACPLQNPGGRGGVEVKFLLGAGVS